MSLYEVAPGVLRASIDEEEVLLNTETGVYHLLNPTGKSVLDAIETGNDLPSVVENIAARYSKDPAIVVQDVQAFVDDLLSRELLVLKGS